jgi:hypothetical protein
MAASRQETVYNTAQGARISPSNQPRPPLQTGTEDGFETAKNELGLDHNETRSWHGWHRHVSLVMLAFAMLAAIRHKANMPAPPKSSLRMIRKNRH